ncbi:MULTISPECIES: poly-beta-1,6 N-acetyl-D-glucosamine export porin PgaA [unclassified Tatumella]|uniref:poly-beta-1,6 N-acetyl-D-glucosamine export porin PgaA n=1 Tax=unclassified Tatumella TaxID=2649542 RepID=UPI001BAF39B6|nr:MULTISPECIES: poly-beta-1,6 N-acetyl-D-glucosamine export porin PgaA [unclassified Tatumella]MBS0856274.1 poly-beta-1,6 N-acetyl-D-glucosamine export porin PgaA [Tatumella sp. JGM16]MBS0913417.1 poly-beta-1,6 N-acetyl-D-glucosamine export porin PgaA [Tatumella sp. JGM91]
MQIFTLKPKLLLVSCLLSCPLSGYAQTQYDSLIIQARAGNYQPVLNWLAKENNQRRLTLNERADWLQVASWAGEDKLVVQLWQQPQTQSLPATAKIAVARAYRNLHQWPQSLSLLESLGAGSSSANADLRELYIMTLADAKRNDQALTRALKFCNDKKDARSYLTLSYVYRAIGQPDNAWQAATKAYSLDPSDKEIRSTYISTLAEQRIVSGQWYVYQAAPGTISEQQAVALQQGAELVRDSLVSGRSEAERFLVADKALSFYQQNIARWQQQPGNQPVIRRARIDRIGAYVARSDMAQAIAEYESLRQHGDVPGYAENWAGTAYLYQRQPEKALSLWRNTLDMNNSDDVNSYFVALTEAEKLSEAQQFAEQLSKKTPYQIPVYGLPTRANNEEWSDVQSMLVTVLRNNNNLPEAQKHAEALSETAPGNQSLAVDVADLYNQRNWPRKAEYRLKRAESIEPSSINLETEQGQVALALQEWHQASLLADDVIKRAPENKSAQQLNDDRNIRNKAELSIEGDKGIKSDSPVTGSHDFNLMAVLYTPPIAENWRVYTGAGYANSRFEEGTGIDRSQLAGVEFTNRNNWLQFDVSHHNYGHGSKAGVRLSDWHDFNDDWRVGALFERLGSSTPLRAMKNGISGNTAAGYVRWQQNERRQVRLDISGTHFSDGNNRQNYSVSAQQRLYSQAYWWLDFTPSVSAGYNSKPGGAYYSPARDLTLLPALSLENILYRHYDTQWSHSFSVGVGRYWEKNYPARLMTTISYGQRLQLAKVFEIGASVNWSKQPYDGDREKDLSLSFDMDYRF